MEEAGVDILDKFYKTAKNNAAKDPTALVQGPLDDMPDAGFDAGETYGGGQGAGGVMVPKGMSVELKNGGWSWGWIARAGGVWRGDGTKGDAS